MVDFLWKKNKQKNFKNLKKTKKYFQFLFSTVATSVCYFRWFHPYRSKDVWSCIKNI